MSLGLSDLGENSRLPAYRSDIDDTDDGDVEAVDVVYDDEYEVEVEVEVVDRGEEEEGLRELKKGSTPGPVHILTRIRSQLLLTHTTTAIIQNTKKEEEEELVMVISDFNGNTDLCK